MSENTTVLQVEAQDSTQAGFDSVKRNADSVAKAVADAGDRAAKGIGAIGSGATESAQSLDRATGNMVGQLRRLAAERSAEMQATKGSADYFEALANARGMDMARIRPYIEELRKVEAEQRRIGTSAAGAAGGIGNIGTAAASASSMLMRLAGVAGAGAGIWKAIGTADEWGQYASRIKLATNSTDEYAEVQERLIKSANNTYRSLRETQEAFITMSPVLRGMGLSLDESITAVDAFSGLLVVNAATADKGASAMDAYNKSLQKGVIDANAWKTITAAMPSVIDVIASSTGKAASEVRLLGASGKLAITDLNKALLEGAGAIAGQVEGMPTTVADALQRLNNTFYNFIGTQNDAAGVTATLVAGLNKVTEHFDKIALAAGVVAVAIGGRLFSALVASGVAFTQNTLKIIAQAVSLDKTSVSANVAAASMSKMAAASRIASAVLSPFGGLVGFAATAISLAALSFMDFGKGAEKARERLLDLSQPLDDVKNKFNELTPALQKAELVKIGSDLRNSLKDADQAFDDLIAKVKSGLSSSINGRGVFSPDAAMDAAAAVQEYSAALANARAKGQDLTPILEEMAQRYKIKPEVFDSIVITGGAYSKLTGDVKNLTTAQNELTAAYANNTIAAQANAGAANVIGAVAGQQIAALERQIALFGKTGAAAAIYYDLDKGNLKDLTEHEKAQIRALADKQAQLEQNARASKTVAAGNISEAQSIRAKITVLEQELDLLSRYGTAAASMTESEKKVLEIESKLGEAISAKQRAMLTEALAEERKKAALEKSIATQKQALQVIDSANQSGEQTVKNLQEQVKYYGLTEHAINQLKEAEAARALAEAQSGGKSQAEIEGLKKTLDLRRQITRESARLDYTKQLDQLNKSGKELEKQSELLKFEATLIGKSAEERKKEVALYEIKRRLAEEINRIEASGASPAEKAALRIQAHKNAYQESANVYQQSFIDAQDEIHKKIEDSNKQLSQSLADNIMRGGKSAADYLKDYFRTLVLKPVIEAAVSPLASALNGSIMGALNQQGGGGGSGGVGGLSSLFSLSGTMDKFSEGLAAMQGGEFMKGASGMLGAAAPWISAAMAATSILKKLFKGKTPHVGAEGVWDTSGTNKHYNRGAENYDPELGKTLAMFSAGIGQAVSGFLKDMGKSSGVWVKTGFAADNKDASWGDFALEIGGKRLVDWMDEEWESKWSPRTFSSNAEEGYKEYVTEVMQSVVKAMQDESIGLTGWANDLLKGLGSDATLEQITAVMQTISQFNAHLKAWSANITGFSGLTDDFISGLVKAAGGFEALSTSVGTYYDRFYSESEKAEAAQKALTDELAKYGVELPATKQAWRELVEEALAAGEGGEEFAAVLFGLSGIFADVADYMSGSIDDLAGSATEAMEKMLADVGINTSNISDVIRDGLLGRMSREDVGARLAETIQAGIYNAIAGNFSDQITGIFTSQIVTPIIQAVLTGGSLSEAVSAQSIAAVTQQAVAAASAIAQIVESVEFQAAMTSVSEAIAGITSVMRPAAASSKQFQSSMSGMAEATTSAAKEISSAWSSIIDSLTGEMRRLRGEILGDSEAGIARYESQFAILTAQARAGDENAAKQLPEVVQALERLTKENAKSQVDVTLMQARYLASLEETRRILASANGIKTSTTYENTVITPPAAAAYVSAISVNSSNADVVRSIKDMHAELKAIGEAQVRQQQKVVYLQERMDAIGVGIREEA